MLMKFQISDALVGEDGSPASYATSSSPALAPTSLFPIDGSCGSTSSSLLFAEIHIFGGIGPHNQRFAQWEALLSAWIAYVTHGPEFGRSWFYHLHGCDGRERGSSCCVGCCCIADFIEKIGKCVLGCVFGFVLLVVQFCSFVADEELGCR